MCLLCLGRTLNPPERKMQTKMRNEEKKLNMQSARRFSGTDPYAHNPERAPASSRP